MRSDIVNVEYDELPIKRPECLFDNKSFWVGACSVMGVYQKNRIKKKVTRKSKIIEILPKLITKILIFFKLAPSFTLAPKKTRALMCKKVLLI